MKKKFTLLLLSFFLCEITSAQTLSIQYEHYLKLGEREKSLPADFVKSLNNTVIAFTYYYEKNKSIYMYLQERARNPAMPRLNSSGGVAVATYKDFSTNFIYQDAKQLPGSVSKEPLKKDQKWKVQKDTCTIAGNHCKKSTLTDNSGNIITAWYAPDIAVSDGPGGYYGLPGMILRLEGEGFVTEAVSVEINGPKEKRVDIQMPKADKYLTQEEFNTLAKKRQ